MERRLKLTIANPTVETLVGLYRLNYPMPLQINRFRYSGNQYRHRFKFRFSISENLTHTMKYLR